MTTEKSKTGFAEAKNDEKIDTNKFKDLFAILLTIKYLEVLKYADVENVAAKALCILQRQKRYISKLMRKPPPIKHRGFLSHVQKHSADLCRSLFCGLKNNHISVWYNMTARKLDAWGMAHKIYTCNYFVFAGTKD